MQRSKMFQPLRRYALGPPLAIALKTSSKEKKALKPNSARKGREVWQDMGAVVTIL